MESQGLIMRVPDRQNRRRIIIKPTSEAEKLKAAYNEVSEKTNEIFYAGFAEEEVTYFEDTLRRILKNFEERENNEK
jgi:DNA-binding MarR family transcriptional regulator